MKPQYRPCVKSSHARQSGSVIVNNAAAMWLCEIMNNIQKQEFDPQTVLHKMINK
jgi:hypothetical protein